MIKYFTIPWKKAFDYRGITSRKEFWYFQLISTVLFLVLNVTQNLITNFQYYAINSGSEYEIYSEILAVLGQTISIITFPFLLGTVVVQCSIRVRRLRDISRKWTWMFLHFIPILGILFFELYFMTRPSKVNAKSDISIDQKSTKIKTSSKINNKALNNKKSSKKAIKSGLVDKGQIIDTNSNEEKSLKEKLADLKELFDQNLINEEEYNNLKGKLLDL